MIFFKRRTNNLPATTSTTTATIKIVNKPTATTRLLINGSKPLSKLLEDHLERLWSASSMNLFIDRKGRISSFIHGEFHLAFKFFTSSGCTDNKFIVACYICKNPAKKAANRGKKVADDMIINEDAFMEKQSEVRITDPTMRLKQQDNGSIVLSQQVSAATVLIDEELEQTLDKFLGTAESIRAAVVPHRKRRIRLGVSSWFQKKAEL